VIGYLMLDRERVGREASPSAAVIDSQSATAFLYAASAMLLITRFASFHLSSEIAS
jgi:hypothetical protein